MRILLIYNPKAGNGVDAELHYLVALIRAAGHDVRCRSSKDPRLESAFDEPADLVAVAGGDGTVAKVARRLRGRTAAIAPLPLGTANNIATALGLANRTFEELIEGWRGAKTVAVDVGLVRGARRSRAFLESFGVGMLPALMATKLHPPRGAASADARLASAIIRSRRTAADVPAIELEASLDGRDVSGRYVLLEASNIGWVGPNLEIAPDADPTDGEFDVVLVPARERTLLVEYLRALEQGAARRPALPTLRGRCLRIAHGDFSVHIDDKVWDAKRALGAATIEVELHDRVGFLVPERAQRQDAGIAPHAGRRGARAPRVARH